MNDPNLNCPGCQCACGTVYWFTRHPEAQVRLRDAIQAVGYQIQIFSTPEELCCYRGSGLPSLVVLEVEDWGDVDEYQSLGCIKREMLDATTVVTLSADRGFESRMLASQLGADRYIDASISEAEFREYIFRLVGNPAEMCNYRVAVMFSDSARRQHREFLDHLAKADTQILLVLEPTDIVEASETFQPDLFLLSFSLPGYSGLEMAAIIHQDLRWTDIPVMLLSNEEEISYLSSGLIAGAEVVLSTETEPDELVRILLGRIKQGREIRNRRQRLETITIEQDYEHRALDAHAIVSVANDKGQIISVNDKFCEVSGYSAQELIGQNHRIVNSGYHPREFFRDMWRTISAGQPWQGEVCNRRKDGRLYWVASTIMPFTNEAGVPYKYVSIRTDITRQKQTELALRVSEERFSRSQSFANIGTWDWNIQTGELYWSERIAPLFGYPENTLETTYENFLNSVHPDDRQLVIDAVNACVEGKAEYRIEHRCIWPNGEVRWMMESGDVTRDADGTPQHMLGVVQDITDRKVAEQSLRRSEARLANAQRIAAIGDWEWDIVQDELVWSDEIYRIFGQEPGSFEPSVKAFFAVVHPDDMPALKESESRAFAGQGHDVVHRIILPDGSVRYVHEHGEVVFDSAGQAIRMSGTVQDVTQRELADQALVKQKEEAERANQAKSIFLSNMSHELRTPLNAILGFAQFLEMDKEKKLTESQHDSLDEIIRAGRHLLDLINEVLDLSRIDAGKIQISLEPVSLSSISEECINLIRPMAEESRIEVEFDAQCDCRVDEVYIKADAIRLKQVLLNILSNAVKYNRSGGRVRVGCGVETEGYVRITIDDTGMGIAEEDIPTLFKPFNRLSSSSHSVEGTGIGLALSKRLVELMKGRVGVSSKLGEGSRFWIELALDTSVMEGQASNKDISHCLEESSRSDRPLKVLYIEDNPANMRLVQKLLEKFGNIQLLCAQNAQLGLDIARFHTQDLVLVDINLPDMDGYEVLRKLREEGYAETPIIAISANAMPADVSKGLALGYNEYLTKPLNVERFMEIVRECIDACC